MGGRAQDQPWGLCLVLPNPHPSDHSQSFLSWFLLDTNKAHQLQPEPQQRFRCAHPPNLVARWLGLPLKCSPRMAVTHSGLPGYSPLCHPFGVNPWQPWKLEWLHLQSMLAHGPLSGQVLNKTKWYQISYKLVTPNMHFCSSLIQSWLH